jgi:hypothetical protein
MKFSVILYFLPGFKCPRTLTLCWSLNEKISRFLEGGRRHKARFEEKESSTGANATDTPQILLIAVSKRSTCSKTASRIKRLIKIQKVERERINSI